MAHSVALIPGDGIGPEISESMRRVVDATGVGIDWHVVDAGAGVMGEYGTPLPEHVLDAVAQARVAIKGPITTPVGTGFRSVNVALRKHFDLYACVRPCLSQPGDGSRYEDVDIVIVRENTEDLYAGIEFEADDARVYLYACVRPCLSQPGDGSRYEDVDIVIVRENTEDLYAGIEFEADDARVSHLDDLVRESGQAPFREGSAISIKPISEFGSRRIVEYAFEYARRCGRRKVTAVHKANIMKATDGLYLRIAREVAERYPDIQFEDKIVDAACMGLVQHPEDFDVLVLPNLYGDIVSDLGAGLVGGLGMAPGANIGTDVAIFEATHGSAPDIAGKGVANPTAQILSAAMMLDHLGETAAAERVRAAVRATLAEGTCVTADVRRALTGSTEGAVGTAAYTDALVAHLLG